MVTMVNTSSVCWGSRTEQKAERLPSTSLPLRQHGASGDKHGVRLLSYTQCALGHNMLTTGSARAVKSTQRPLAGASLNEMALVSPHQLRPMRVMKSGRLMAGEK